MLYFERLEFGLFIVIKLLLKLDPSHQTNLVTASRKEVSRNENNKFKNLLMF